VRLVAGEVARVREVSPETIEAETDSAFRELFVAVR
jgi:Tat protein secretion system quality control protein TatD with DNase activity